MNLDPLINKDDPGNIPQRCLEGRDVRFAIHVDEEPRPWRVKGKRQAAKQGRLRMGKDEKGDW